MTTVNSRALEHAEIQHSLEAELIKEVANKKASEHAASYDAGDEFHKKINGDHGTAQSDNRANMQHIVLEATQFGRQKTGELLQLLVDVQSKVNTSTMQHELSGFTLQLKSLYDLLTAFESDSSDQEQLGSLLEQLENVSAEYMVDSGQHIDDWKGLMSYLMLIHQANMGDDASTISNTSVLPTLDDSPFSLDNALLDNLIDQTMSSLNNVLSECDLPDEPNMHDVLTWMHSAVMKGEKVEDIHVKLDAVNKKMQLLQLIGSKKPHNVERGAFGAIGRLKDDKHSGLSLDSNAAYDPYKADNDILNRYNDNGSANNVSVGFDGNRNPLIRMLLVVLGAVDLVSGDIDRVGDEALAGQAVGKQIDKFWDAINGLSSLTFPVKVTVNGQSFELKSIYSLISFSLSHPDNADVANAVSSLRDALSSVGPFLDPGGQHIAGANAWDQLKSLLHLDPSGTSDSDYEPNSSDIPKANAIIDGWITTMNAALAKTGTTTTVGKFGKASNGAYEFTSNTLGSMSSALKTGATAANNVNQHQQAVLSTLQGFLSNYISQFASMNSTSKDTINTIWRP